MNSDEARAQLIRTNADRVRYWFLQQYPDAWRCIDWQDDLHPIKMYDPPAWVVELMQNRRKAGAVAAAAWAAIIGGVMLCGAIVALTFWRV